MRYDVAFEVGLIRQELESMWKQWKSDHPIKALFKSQRQKVIAYLKNCNTLFGKKEFYEAFAKGEYGDRFANFCYHGSIGGKWPKS